MAHPTPPSTFDFQMPEGGISFGPSPSSSSNSNSSSSKAPDSTTAAFASKNSKRPQPKHSAHGGSPALAKKNDFQGFHLALEHETHPDTDELRKVRGLRDLAVAARDIQKGLTEDLQAEKVAMLKKLKAKDALIEELQGTVTSRDTVLEDLRLKYNKHVAEYNEMHDELTEREDQYDALIDVTNSTRLTLHAANEHNKKLQQRLESISDVEEKAGLLIEPSHASLQTVESNATPEGSLETSSPSFKDASRDTEMPDLVDPHAETRPVQELSEGDDLSDKLKDYGEKWMRAEEELQKRTLDLQRIEEQTRQIKDELEAEKSKVKAAESIIKNHAKGLKEKEKYIGHFEVEFKKEQEKVKELEENAKLHNYSQTLLKDKLKQAEEKRDVWMKREQDNSESAKHVYARAARLEKELKAEQEMTVRLTGQLHDADDLRESLLETENLLEAAYDTIEKLREETPAFNPLPDANIAPATTRPQKTDNGMGSGLSDLENQSSSEEASSSSNKSSTRLSEMGIESDEAVSETESEETLGGEDLTDKPKVPEADHILDETGCKIIYVDRAVPAETKIIRVPQIEFKEVIKEVKGDPYPVPGELIKVEVPGPVRYVSTGGGCTSWFSTELAIVVYFLNISRAILSSFAQMVRGAAPITSEFHPSRERDSGSDSDLNHESDSGEQDDDRSLTDDTEEEPVTAATTGATMSAVVVGGPANLGESGSGSGPAPGTDPISDEEALKKTRRDPKFKEYLEQSRNDLKKNTDPERKIDLSSMFPPLEPRSKDAGEPYKKVTHPQPDSTGSPPPPPPAENTSSTIPTLPRQNKNDKDDEPAPTPVPEKKFKKSRTGGPPPPPPENLFTQMSPDFGTVPHFLWTLFWFALHCVFYYLCWVALSTYWERELWRGANEATRAMLTNWLGYRYPTQGIFHAFLSPSHASAIDRSLIWIFSFCIDFQAFPLPG
ncbi:hypothetical protein PZA11_007438 [Diplocarpon coronariae]